MEANHSAVVTYSSASAHFGPIAANGNQTSRVGGSSPSTKRVGRAAPALLGCDSPVYGCGVVLSGSAVLLHCTGLKLTAYCRWSLCFIVQRRTALEEVKTRIAFSNCSCFHNVEYQPGKNSAQNCDIHLDLKGIFCPDAPERRLGAFDRRRAGHLLAPADGRRAGSVVVSRCGTVDAAGATAPPLAPPAAVTCPEGSGAGLTERGADQWYQ